MNTHSDIQFPGEHGAHLTFAEAPCPGRHFQIIDRERGALAAVKCELCHRVLEVREPRIIDPLRELATSLHTGDNAVAAIRAAYTYRHGKEDHTAEIPTKWFISAQDAYRVFTGCTDESVLMAWPWSDQGDRLEKATIIYSLRQDDAWKIVEQRPITPD